MVSLFASGRIVDIVLAVTILEAVALVIYHRHYRCGLEPANLLATLLPGACLMLALRAALIDDWWGWIAFWLAVAFAAHLNDLRRRWPS